MGNPKSAMTQKVLCRSAADFLSAAKSMPKYATERNFAADLPHTSLLQEQSAADLRQDETLLQTCCIPVCSRNSLRQICGRMKLCSRLAAYQYATGTVCGRSATEKWEIVQSAARLYRRPFWRSIQYHEVAG